MNEVTLAALGLLGGGSLGAVAVAVIKRPVDRRLAGATVTTADAQVVLAAAQVAKVSGEQLSTVLARLDRQGIDLASVLQTLRELQDVVAVHLRTTCTTPPDDALRIWRPPTQRPPAD